MRVTSAFCRLLRLEDVWVRGVEFLADRVVVRVALRRKRLVCPLCGYATMAREGTQDHESSWRHLDLGVWRLEVRATLRQLRCPEHGVHVEGVPFARHRARMTRDFDDLVAWLATKADKTTITRLVRIDWQTIGRVIERVGAEHLDRADRLADLFEISVDEVAWRKGHRYLTLVGDHARGCVVWGCEGKGQAAADAFFAALDPPPEAPAPEHATQPPQPEPAIMVPFGRCPTVPAGEGITAAWLREAEEIDPAIFARASRLRAVSMDMTGGYAKSVREHAPHATIVIDNYHVCQLATTALDDVRREHWNQLRQTGDKHAATVAELIDRLLARLSRSRLKPFVRLGRTIRKHREGILAARRLGLSNARAEALNNKAKLIVRRAYGFHSARAALALIHLTCGPFTLTLPHEKSL